MSNWLHAASTLHQDSEPSSSSESTTRLSKVIAGALAGCLPVWEYKHCAFVTTCDRVNTCHVLIPYVALASGSHGGGVTFEKATQLCSSHLYPVSQASGRFSPCVGSFFVLFSWCSICFFPLFVCGSTDCHLKDPESIENL